MASHIIIRRTFAALIAAHGLIACNDEAAPNTQGEDSSVRFPDAGPPDFRDQGPPPAPELAARVDSLSLDGQGDQVRKDSAAGTQMDSLTFHDWHCERIREEVTRLVEQESR